MSKLLRPAGEAKDVSETKQASNKKRSSEEAKGNGKLKPVEKEVEEKKSRNSKENNVDVRVEHPKDSHDLVEIANPNIDNLLRALQSRCAKKAFCSSIDDILLSVNSFTPVENCFPLLAAFHVNARESQVRELSPHVFGTARRAYLGSLGRRDSDLDYTRDQTIVIMGQSGAGKTEACKLALQYLAHISAYCKANRPKAVAEAKADNNGEDDSMEAKMTGVGAVLEAFGNAKTLRNDNSSRFGKWISIQYSPWGFFLGGTITKFGLEESRVVFQIKGERNFNIFYQVLSALKDSNLDVHSCPYLNQSAAVATENDRNAFIEVVEGLRCVGFSQLERTHLFNVIKAILYLGQITFVKSNAGTVRVGSANAAEDQSAQRALVKATEYLMGNEKDDALRKALCSQILTSGNETITMPRTLEQADYVRDELAQHLYGRLFNYVMKRINDSLSPFGSRPASSTATSAPREHGSSRTSAVLIPHHRTPSSTALPPLHQRNPSLTPMNSHQRNPSLTPIFRASTTKDIKPPGVPTALPLGLLGILDMPGYENFVENNLDQLFINYQDEKVQSYFQHMPTTELELYNREKLQFSSVQVRDKTTCAEMLEDRPHGILCVLEDEVNTAGGSDARFLEKIWAGQKGHPCFMKGDDFHNFTVQHYAGPVTYTVDGTWLDTNKSKIGEDVLSIFPHSAIALVKGMFEEKEAKEMKAEGLLSPMSPMMSPMSPSGMIKPSGKAALDAKLEGHGVIKRKLNATSSLLRASLALLCRSLDTSTLHFIQCIKINSIKKPDVFDEALVRQQLASSGVLDALLVRQIGFSERMVHAKFKARYLITVNGRFASPPLVEQFRSISKQTLESSKNVPRDAHFATVLLRTLCADLSWQVGLNKVFYRAATSVKLEEIREQVLARAAIVSARKIRLWYAKRLLKRRKQAWGQVKSACMMPMRDFKVIKAAILKARTCGVPEGLLWEALRDAELQQVCDDSCTALHAVVVVKLLRVLPQGAVLSPRGKDDKEGDVEELPSLKAMLDILQAGLMQLAQLGGKYGLKLEGKSDRRNNEDEIFEINKDLIAVQQKPLKSASSTLLIALHTSMSLLVQALNKCLTVVKECASTNMMKEAVLRQCVTVAIEGIKNAVSPQWAKQAIESMRAVTSKQAGISSLDSITLAGFQKWYQDLEAYLSSLNSSHVEGLQELAAMASLLQGVSELEVRLQSAIDQKDLPSIQANLKMAQEVSFKHSLVDMARIAAEGLKLEATVQNAIKSAEKDALGAALSALKQASSTYKGEQKLLFEKMFADEQGIEGARARIAQCEVSMQQSQKLSMSLKNAIRSKDENAIKQILEKIAANPVTVLTTGLKAAISEATRGQQQIELREEVKRELALRNSNDSVDVQVARYTNLLSRIQELGMTQMDDAISKLTKKRNEASCKQQLQAAIESEDVERLKQVIQSSSQTLRNSGDVADGNAINELIRRAQVCLKRTELVLKLRQAYESDLASQAQTDTRKQNDAFEEFSQAYSMCVVAGVDNAKMEFAVSAIDRVKAQWEEQKQARQASTDAEQLKADQEALKVKQLQEAKHAEKEMLKQKLADAMAEKDRKEREGPAPVVIPTEVTNLGHASKPKAAGRKPKSNAKFSSPSLGLTVDTSSSMMSIIVPSPVTPSGSFSSSSLLPFSPATPAPLTPLSNNKTLSFTTPTPSARNNPPLSSLSPPMTPSVASASSSSSVSATYSLGVQGSNASGRLSNPPAVGDKVSIMIEQKEPEGWLCPLCDKRNETGLDRCLSCRASVSYRWLKELDLANNVTQEITDRIFAAFDTDGNKVLDEAETQLFVTEWCRQHKVANPETVAKVFWERFHDDGSGNINQEALLAGLSAATRTALTVTRMQDEAAAAQAEADAEVETLIAAAAERLERARLNLLRSREELLQPASPSASVASESNPDKKEKKSKMEELPPADIDQIPSDITYRVISEKGVRVRLRPSLDAKQTGRLEFGTTIIVSDTRGKWVKHSKGWSLVESEGKKLMEIVTDLDMFAKTVSITIEPPEEVSLLPRKLSLKLSPSSSPVPASPVAPVEYVVIAEGGVEIRALPSLNAEERGRLIKGTAVKVISIKKNWLRHLEGWTMLYNTDTVYMDKLEKESGNSKRKPVSRHASMMNVRGTSLINLGTNVTKVSYAKTGWLYIHILGASNLRLPSSDSAPSAYVSAVCGDKRLHSTVVAHSFHPEWDQTLCFAIEDSGAAKVKLSVKHKRIGTSVLLGDLKIIVAEVALIFAQQLGNHDGGRKIRKVWPLSNAESGEIELSIHFVAK